MSLQKSIRRFGDLAMSGKYLTISDLVEAAACSATIGTAASNLKLIKKVDGRIIATWQGRCPHGLIEAEYHRLRESCGKKPKKAEAAPAENWKEELQEQGLYPTPVSLADAIAVVIEAGGTVVFGDKK